MKKQLLILLSTMFLLTACGNNNPTDTGTTPKPDTTTDDTPSSSDEPAKIDVTIKITASGIEEYSGSHSTLYINSNFDSSDWSTHAMTQDVDNENVWTYKFNDIEVDCKYRFNIYYGNDTEPDWSNGINAEGDSNNPLTVTVSEDKTLYEFTSTFTIPTVSHSFKLVLTPHIQPTEGKDETMYDSTYVWMWHSTNSTDVLTKQDDGTWTYDVTEYVGDNYEFTACLGNKANIDWKYQYGAYENGSWTKWDKSTKFTLVEGTTSYSFDVYFNAQPDEVTGETYSVTWHYLATNWDNVDGKSLQVVYSVNGGTDNWANMNWDETSTSYNYTLTVSEIPSDAAVEYYLYTYKNDSNRYLASDTDGTKFKITVTKDLEYIITGDFGATANAYGAGTATLVE